MELDGVMKECQKRMIEEAEFEVSERHELHEYLYKMFMRCKETNNKFLLRRIGHTKEIPKEEMIKIAEAQIQNACDELYKADLSAIKTEG